MSTHQDIDREQRLFELVRDPLFVTARRRAHRCGANAAALELLGLHRGRAGLAPVLGARPSRRPRGGRARELAQVLRRDGRARRRSACRVVRPDGEIRWVESQSTRRRRQPASSTRSSRDITDREEAFMDRLAGAFRDAPLGMALVAPGGALPAASTRRCAGCSAAPSAELLGRALCRRRRRRPRVAHALRRRARRALQIETPTAPPRRPPGGRARQRDARARHPRRAAVLRLPGPRHDRALRGAGRAGRQRGQARRGPADRAAGLAGSGRSRPTASRGPTSSTASTACAPDGVTGLLRLLPRQGPRRRPRPRRARHRDGADRAPAVEPRLPHRPPRRRAAHDPRARRGRPRRATARPAVGARHLPGRHREPPRRGRSCAPPSSSSAAPSTTRRSAWRSSTSTAAGCA